MKFGLFLLLAFILAQHVVCQGNMDDLGDVGELQGHSMKSLQDENSLLKTRLEALELLFSSLSGDVQALETSTDERFHTMNSDIQTVESEVTNLESDVTNLKNDVSTLGNNLTDYSDTAFQATHSAESFTPGDPIVWNTAILNPGGHYNPESGIYTVPVDGIYQFIFHYQNYANPDSSAYLKVDGVEVALLRNVDDSVGAPVAEMTVLFTLTSGQEVWTSPGFMEAIWGTDPSRGFINSWFSGHLIYPL